MAAVLTDLADAGSRDDTPARPRVSGADAFVVRVEEIRVGGMEGPVSP
jgi:hypothetical protein